VPRGEDPQATPAGSLLPRLVSIQVFEIQSCRRPVRTGPRKPVANPRPNLIPTHIAPGRPPRSTPFVSKSVSKIATYATPEIGEADLLGHERVMW